jgi:tetratricopeptide (TPR) repeat protein
MRKTFEVHPLTVKMDEATQLEKQRRAAILANEVLEMESSQQRWCWIFRHLDQFDEHFFSALEGNENHSESEKIAGYVHVALSRREFIEKQADLLREIVSSTNPTERRSRLETHLPEITADFFPLLLCHSAESSYNASEATSLCNEMLESIGFNDLRDDWDSDTFKLIKGVACFVQREQDYAGFLCIDNFNQPIPYAVVELSMLRIRDLEEGEDKPVLGLAVLNLLLSRSKHVMYGEPPRSFTDVTRYQLFFHGARLIKNLGINRSLINARRLVEEAQQILENVLANPVNQEPGFRIKIAGDSAVSLDMLGDLALEENRPEESLSLLQQGLKRREELWATVGSLDDYLKRAMNIGLANTLWRLANAEVRLWRLDDAAEHRERAINMYRSTGDRGEYIAGHLEELAKIEFLRTNFERAEALLEEAGRERRTANQ